ncbi:MAG TPA: hypothetical protein V6C52_06325 [Coleofasciculaceae cyanobacterium]|jgi:hypothetical protein
MGSKRGYAFLTMVLIVASIGTGFAMQQESRPHLRAALQSLETARMQMGREQADQNGCQGKALALIEQAIREVKAEVPVR